jgi:hypothetical protein
MNVFPLKGESIEDHITLAIYAWSDFHQIGFIVTCNFFIRLYSFILVLDDFHCILLLQEVLYNYFLVAGDSIR